ncbi:MAG: hypothetical protein A3J09_01470 [Candidatus Zambryskibacteria bacterium RIFCSPLOWO2_02_FULL_51_21]|uniref:Cardiolipin synthase N-terminal domain-containing protein n=1 Tax=Candidatus Zambryskibacteria bacterium RIFCSPHIGHO2_02_FULL_43_37 TaxID=1802749 RepID=A0A1G2TGV6_9BACT|nr:MAG: hypothetical protein A2723_01470 [Candidatus Zambryskibacteria bacterium RIFCSPHIGHO2_01_FULL_52_18]OHA96520.1 MAG: hypothetical protein A3D49_01430 [Candidatus Zambryskibacteria bacterium RIFCSPHIGHO2_02_FULL_43_37]OHB07189.1 MAG: hypothetical protein A2944_01195 [Candidatus Zambryskibacteria bacterium RIFCSPLOWO2_01_FULL_52_12]OHB11216.1 MAG: hypothetical protein A3J09_01470 [Candidatus Zambryskibacteria bacterium RIFCSPLOWO2_02_FULL_51_21]
MVEAFAGIMAFKTVLFIIWLILFVWAMMDILGTRKSVLWKTLWILACFVFPILGVVLYGVFGRRK